MNYTIDKHNEIIYNKTIKSNQTPTTKEAIKMLRYNWETMRYEVVGDKNPGLLAEKLDSQFGDYSDYSDYSDEEDY